MLGRKTVFGSIRQQHPRHVLTKFLGARVGIVVGTIPFDRAIFGDDFVAALARYRDGADLAETPQAVIVLRLPRQSQHFERAAQVHVQATLLRLAIQRRRAMNHRIRGVHQPVVFIAIQAEARRSQVSAKNPHLGLQVLEEPRKIQVQLQRTPQAQLRLLRIARPHQHVQGGAVPFQQIGSNVRADVSGRPGQEYRHVAPSVPVFTASPLAGAS